MSNFHFAFDLDGTITKKEILPLIAEELNIKKRMKKLTDETMAGKIPFDQSFTLRVEMLKKVSISKVQKIVSKVALSKPILEFLQNNSSRCHIVTGNLDVWIFLLMQKIGVDCLCSEAYSDDDQLLGIKNILRKKIIHSTIPNPIVAIGDGYNDLEMLIDAPISIAYGGVHPPVNSLTGVAKYIIYDDTELCRFLKQLL